MKFLKPCDIKEMGKRYFRYPGPFAIDEPDLEYFFPGISNIKTNEYHRFLKGQLEIYNLKFINKLVKYLQPKTIVEIGTFKGRTTYNMAKNTKESKIITIDIADGETDTYSGVDLVYHMKKEKVGLYYKNTKVEERITQLFTDSLSPRCQMELDLALGGKKIDFAFIDAGHDYESVRHNFEELVLPRLAYGGIVVFEDYIRPLSIIGVSHYLLQKAHDDGYIFYWYAPREGNHTNDVIFVNLPEARNYNWRHSGVNVY